MKKASPGEAGFFVRSYLIGTKGGLLLLPPEVRDGAGLTVRVVVVVLGVELLDGVT